MAERAGVQRHVYAHFPDERSLLMACSGLAAERDPLPASDPWRAIADPAQRLAAGLRPLYDWYERNAQRTACVLRDAEHHPLVKEVGYLRFGVPMGAYAEVLGAGLDARQRAMLRLAMSFFTWRTLARDAGLGQDAAVDAMVRAILCAGAAIAAAR